MKMPGQNAASLELLRANLAAGNFRAEQKKMFGHETYFLRGYMFAGVFGDDIFVHVGLENVEASRNAGTGFFEPMGKRMRSYLTLPAQLQNTERLMHYLRMGSAYLEKLPAKTTVKKTVTKKGTVKKKSTLAKKPSARSSKSPVTRRVTVKQRKRKK